MSILSAGNVADIQTGRASWKPSSAGLDTVTVTAWGAVAAIDTYMASLVQWSAFADDANMFLSSWDSDEDPITPAVTLTYIGKRNGTLPQTQHSTDNQMQAVKQDVVTPTFDLLYLSPTATTVDLARTATAFSPAIIPDSGKLRVLFIKGNLGRIVVPPGIDLSLWFLSYFFPVWYTIPKSTELVPNQYYRNDNTTAVILFPIPG